MNRNRNYIENDRDSFATAAEIMRLVRNLETPADAARALMWTHVLLIEEAGAGNSLELTESAASAMAEDVISAWRMRNVTKPPKESSAGRPELRVVRNDG
jgi:hypothetical protein